MVQNIHETTMQMKATLKEYEELASTDPLTKVFNHGRIETEMRNAIEKYRKEGTPTWLMILDIDHFKNVNDRYGHAVGDTTLVNIANMIKDTLGDKNTEVGRWGGEEFVVVVYDETEGSVRELAEKLRRNIEASPSEIIGALTVSIGVTELRSEDNSPESWFARADHSLYTMPDS